MNALLSTTLLAAAQPGLADLPGLAPSLVLVAGGCLLLLLEVGTKGEDRSAMPWVSAAFALGAAFVAWYFEPSGGAIFNGSAAADGYASFFAVIICIALALSSLAAPGYLAKCGLERGEFYGLMLLAGSGMLVAAMATDLLTLFVCIEVMSIGTYALVAFRRDRARSAEAALKYLILGALSSAILLYGMALLFTASGGLGFRDIAAASTTASPVFLAGAALAAVGLAFKVAAVPFHMWTPDVYEGAPTPVTGFMAAAVKAAAFAALVRLFLTGMGAADVATGTVGWGQIFYWLSMATVVLGNLLALVQENVKRMLAYSSIAHAGYALLAVTASAWGGPTLVSSVLVYLLVYAITATGAFAVVGAVEKMQPEGDTDTGHIDDLAGLATRRPGLALAMTVFMFSLAGVPPTGGFIAKLEVFRSILAAARIAPEAATHLYVLAVVGVLASAVGVYYYLRVIVWMYMKPAPEGAPALNPVAALRTGVAAAALLVLLLGVLPGPVSGWAQRAVHGSLGSGAAHLAMNEQ